MNKYLFVNWKGGGGFKSYVFKVLYKNLCFYEIFNRVNFKFNFVVNNIYKNISV